MARRLNDEVQLKLRFNEQLRKRLERAAAQSDHSMNGEIIHRLTRSFENQDRTEELIKVFVRENARMMLDLGLFFAERRSSPPSMDEIRALLKPYMQGDLAAALNAAAKGKSS
jgi:hypothetical protein